MEQPAAWLAAIEQSGIGRALRESLWLYPAVEIAHILGFVLLVGGIAIYDLRLMGWVRAMPADLLARSVLPAAKAGFVLAVAAGLTLFTAEATTMLKNPMLLAKFALILLGLINIAIFHGGIFRRVEQWRTGPPPLAAKLAGAVSLAAWVGAIICGRLIAYV